MKIKNSIIANQFNDIRKKILTHKITDWAIIKMTSEIGWLARKNKFLKEEEIMINPNFIQEIV